MKLKNNIYGIPKGIWYTELIGYHSFGICFGKKYITILIPKISKIWM